MTMTTSTQHAHDARAYDSAAKRQFADDAEGADLVASVLGPLLLAEFSRAEIERRDTETRWLADLRQYRGQYDPDVLSDIGATRSKVFVRKTRVKVKTVNSRVADLLFPTGSEKNWTVENTPVPSVAPEQEAQVVAELLQASGQQPTPEQLKTALLERAKLAAKGMSQAIEDQLVEARYKKASVQAIHSAHLYGTGIIKGPLVEKKVRTQFILKHGKWAPQSQTYITPFVDYVPLWRFYPDMSATTIEDCRYTYERHLMTKAAFAALAERKSFNSCIIRQHILSNPDGLRTNTFAVDTELRTIGERSQTQAVADGQYEVLERWGWLDGAQLTEAGLKVPEDRLHESFFANVWLLPNGEVIKAVLQPINGVTWPYHLYYFDKDETSIFAEGLASIMRDDQTMINAGIRMSLDNAAITAGAMLEVTPGLLSSLEKVTEIHPWKVWLRNATNPGSPAVRPISLTSNLNELLQLVDVFEQNADEVTAIPRYMSGENATQGAAGTASGMSMLMGAANIVIKDLITNWDEGITRPFLQALYRWNMQFHTDPSIKGDFDVKARGTASLVAKEVRANQLNNFSELTANPLDAPYIKRDKLLLQRAEANELSDVVKTEEEMKAEQSGPAAQQQQQAAQQLQQAQMAEMQAKVAKLVADAQRILAQAEQIKAQAVSTKVQAAYEALQAGGVATTSPQVAMAGDEILRSAGWVDATPQTAIAEIDPAPSGTAPVPPMAPRAGERPTALAGARRGIETPVVEGMP
ncbi:hypothetical protein [Polaromonas sp. CG9_12]|nr:hypothetical protein [Polaromonas sp. CG9_12]